MQHCLNCLKNERRAFFGTIALILVSFVSAQNIQNNPQSNHGNKFEQLGTILPTPNEYRTASGAPGAKYWQQRADYDIDVKLDEKNLSVIGTETVTYHNNAPENLNFLWLQLDENQHDPTNEVNYFDENKINEPYTQQSLKSLETKTNLEGLGDKIDGVTDEFGKALKYTINGSMMRIDLPKLLVSKAKFKFIVKWHYKMINRMEYGGRGGYEYFPEDGNYLFTLTQWYPRMCVYSDFHGWQNKQFTGRGEFALAFGNFKVKMTVPSDHLVCSTGECQNYQQVLTPAQYTRWQKAQTASEPTEIGLLEDAKNAEKNKATGTKTWIFKADSVRDFAWGSSRKYIWDAMPVQCESKKVMCMSFYGKEAYGLYRKYSTKVVAHTIKTYSKFTIPYPYPVAQSIEAANGMEYPMICFNFGRTEKDGTYTEGSKNGMILVIIHEVGHNFFPMIINSDERQWSWMDEGLNTFVQYLTEREFDPNYPSQRGPAYKMTDYMRLPKNMLEPIMVNSENIINFGSNAYGKPATALNILRETVMGRELFDFAFKQYCNRWAFKHPEPADFFRTMEDASAVDLDWFWRGWFYDIEPVDISIDTVKAYAIKQGKKIPVKMDTVVTRPKNKEFEYITTIRNRQAGLIPLVDADTTLRDFYYHYKPKPEITKEVKNRNENLEEMPDSNFSKYSGKFIYEIKFSNKGGLVSPIIIQFNYSDGSSEIERINAYIWRKNEKEVTKTFLKSKKVTSILIDPYKETADIDEKNNAWNIASEPDKFELFKSKSGAAVRGQSAGENPMQKAKQK
ncbi:M1 family metallopeptidase [Aurantibacillus circumpalustris]|uniref:M1 family metallopeptidase n=1 Tax=Aurantibacillus circumpalustris TaxID=3036359 RepID=UPI00295C0E26|nr:M1 family metallopeptidase [Aurantibacillus circumpalustris]